MLVTSKDYVSGGCHSNSATSIMSIKLPKKELRIAHVNICSLKNKIEELSCVSVRKHITDISETHSNTSREDAEVAMKKV